MQRLIKDMNGIYREHPAFWKLDTDASGFSWINADDRGGNVFSWLRFDGDGQMIACVTNFSTEPRPDYRIGLPSIGVWKEILNTDADVYDGTGQIGNLGQVVATEVPAHGYPASAAATVPPLGAVWLRFEPVLDEEQDEPEKAVAGVRARARKPSPGAFAVGVGVGVPPGATPAPRLDRGGRREGGEAGYGRGTGGPDVDEIEAATIQPAPRVTPRTSQPPRAEPGRSADQT